MHANAFLFKPLLDTLSPAANNVFADPRSVRQFKSTTYDPLLSSGEGLLSMTKLHERLSLLVQLELPCTILIVNPRLNMPHVVIKVAELNGESLIIAGNDFNLRLLASNIDLIRLVNHGKPGNGIISLDIHHSLGGLYASIQPAPGGIGGEVWRDVMGNPSLSVI